MNLSELLLQTCFDAISEYQGVEVFMNEDGDGFLVKVADDYLDVTLDIAEVEPEEEEEGSRLGSYPPPAVIHDHVTLLDAMLAAISRERVLCDNIWDITTDGDHRDCEAIFRMGSCYRILKVR